MADRDTILERFDKDPVFKEWEEPKSFKVLAEHSFLRCSYQLPIKLDRWALPKSTALSRSSDRNTSRSAGRTRLVKDLARLCARICARTTMFLLVIRELRQHRERCRFPLVKRV